MKKHHKAFVAQATPLRKAIKDEVLKAQGLHDDLEISLNEVKRLESELSVVEAEAAEAGLSTSDLHAAINISK